MSSSSLLKSSPFIVGISLGVILSLLLTPLFEDHCDRKAQKSASSSSSSGSSPKSLNWYQEIIDSDYDPVIKLVNIKPEVNVTQKSWRRTKPLLKRPRLYSTELGIKDSLFVGILTTEQSLNNLGQAINKTLSPFADKLVFFVESSSPSSTLVEKNSPFVVLLQEETPMGANSGQSPSRSGPSFVKIVDYLTSNETEEGQESIASKYNFLFLVNDKSYVKGSKLRRLVSQLTVTESFLIVGASDREQLAEVCSKGPEALSLDSGVLFNSKLLFECESQSFCWIKYCQRFFVESYHVLYDKSDEMILDRDLFKSSLITQPIYTASMHFKLHLLWSQFSLQDTYKQLDKVERDLLELDKLQEVSPVAALWPLSVEPSYKPKTRFEVIRWHFLNDTHYFLPNDFDVVLPQSLEEMEDLSYVKQLCVQWLNRQPAYSGLLRGVEFVDMYRRLDLTRGLEYIIDAKVYTDSQRNTYKMKRLEVLKPLNRLELIPGVPYVTEHVNLNIVLPVKSEQEVEGALLLIGQYANICLKRANHQTMLILILIYPSTVTDHDIYSPIKSLGLSLENKYKSSSSKIIWISLRTGKVAKVPGELAYIDLMSKKLFSSLAGSLVVHCRANTLLSFDYLNRVRMNTMTGFQVFFPIPFVEFKFATTVYEKQELEVRKESGYFNVNDFQHFSFYLNDYLTARASMRHIVPIAQNDHDLVNDYYYDNEWDVYQLFLAFNLKGADPQAANDKEARIHIMRAVEPELRLKYIKGNCESNEGDSYSLANCLNRYAVGLGSKSRLASIVNEEEEKAIKTAPNNEEAKMLP